MLKFEQCKNVQVVFEWLSCVTMKHLIWFSKGMKANVSEADHPLLCESIRKQRGELALSMLLHYKDDVNKLSKVCHTSVTLTVSLVKPGSL